MTGNDTLLAALTEGGIGVPMGVFKVEFRVSGYVFDLAKCDALKAVTSRKAESAADLEYGIQRATDKHPGVETYLLLSPWTTEEEPSGDRLYRRTAWLFRAPQ